jgi:hypothetical protein
MVVTSAIAGPGSVTIGPEDACQMGYAVVLQGEIGVSSDLNDVGRAHLARGEFDAALEAFTEALAIRSRLEPGGDDEAATVNNLGQAHWKRGDPRSLVDRSATPSLTRPCRHGLTIATVGVTTGVTKAVVNTH